MKLKRIPPVEPDEVSYALEVRVIAKHSDGYDELNEGDAVVEYDTIEFPDEEFLQWMKGVAYMNLCAEVTKRRAKPIAHLKGAAHGTKKDEENET